MLLMNKSTLMSHFDACARFFVGCRSGNTALVFALGAGVMFTALAAAVDFSRVMSAKQNMQDAADVAVLYSTGLGSMSEADQEATTHAEYLKNINNPDVNTTNTDLTIGKGSQSEQENSFVAEAKVAAIFGGLVGYSDYAVKVESKAKTSFENTEIVFALDVTGSMNLDGRMGHLKSSVNKAITSLEKTVNGAKGIAKIGIIPFNTQVRLTADPNLSYVDYGTQSVYETCSGLSGDLCSVAWDVFDKVCVAASDMNDCRAKAKGQYQLWNSGGRSYVRVTYRSYQPNGSAYKIFSFTETFYRESTGSYSYGPSCNPETGVCSGGGTGTGSKFVFESYSRNDKGAPNTAWVTTLDSGFSGLSSSALTFGISNSGGYGGNSEKIETSTTYGNVRKKVLPAKPHTRNNWGGCIIDRTQPYDTQHDAPNTSLPDTLYPARNCADNNLKVVRALSDDYAAQRSFVSSFVPGGNTNITIGMQWALEAFSDNAPLTGGKGLNDKTVRRYLILVTDGANTQNRWTSTTSSIDDRTKKVCENAKKQGIEIFVVRVMEGNSALLSACASKPENYYDLKNAAQLDAAMTSIFESIGKTRLTR